MPHPPTAELNWWQSAILAVVLFGAGFILARLRPPFAQRLAPFLKEAGIVALLFSLWQRAGELSQHSTASAFLRGRWVNDAERAIGLPNERSLELPLVNHPWLGQWANLYYAVMHLTTTGVMLLWLFWRHREKYPRIRTGLAIFTGLALIVQLIAVAPPRLMPELGFIDIGERYGQSVYANAGFSAQALLAMPSVHVGWALVVAGAVLYAGRGRWRYLVVLHPLLTLYVITATGNHWWFDSIASFLLLACIVGGQAGWARLRRPPDPLRRQVAAEDAIPAAVPVTG